MVVHIKPPYQPPLDLSLEKVNALLQNGELTGDEPAWVAGLQEWVPLKTINGVRVLPPPPGTTPPPFSAESFGARHGSQASQTVVKENLATTFAQPNQNDINQINRHDLAQRKFAANSYRNINTVAGVLKVLLGLGIVVGVVSMASSIMQIELLSRKFTVAEGQANDTRERVIGITQLAVYIISAVIFARWIIRANKNARALGARNLRISPGWAVGYFFIPIFFPDSLFDSGY